MSRRWLKLCIGFSNYARPFHHQKNNVCLYYVVVIVIALGVILMGLNIYQLLCMRTNHELHIPELVKLPVLPTRNKKQLNTTPIVWIQGSFKSNNNGPGGYLRHVYLVFEKMGFSVGENKLSNWVVAWIHDYPFITFVDVMTNLKPHQKVNHFPGSGYITNKVSLAQTNFSFIPKAFEIPAKEKQFLEYARKHKNISWVQKSNQHRGVQVKSVDNIDLSKEGTFVQEYISRPFLIDGRKFDIGVYAVITSLDPLRVYYIDGDALFRFCPDEYYPFQSSNIDKYVVRDDYLPLWQIPSLEDLYEKKGFSFKNAFNEYLDSIGKDSRSLWEKIKSAIRDITLKKESDLIVSLQKYPSKRNFFELVRFDFVLDENLNVFLMECNMSPNLSSDHFPKNARLYEHVLFNVLNLVGVGHFISRSNRNILAHNDIMLVSSQDIQVFPDYCKGNFCSGSCQIFVCKLCNQCLQKDLEIDFKIAYLEHTHRGSARRIFPPTISQSKALEWSPGSRLPLSGHVHMQNRLMFLWFIGKCRLDAVWCQ